MYGTNLNAEPNFHLQALNQYGVKYVSGPYTSYNQDVFRAFTAISDCVVTATAVVGDSLTSQIIYAGTTVYGLFTSIVVTSGNAILHLAEPSPISELINKYYNTANQYGYFSEAETCTSQRLNPYLTRDLYNKASWMLFPSQYKEDFVRAFKPTDDSGSLSFTRSSDGTRTNSAGQIERVAWNLVQYSEMFSDASWAKTQSTVGVNTITAPNGTLTADTLTATSTFPRVVQNPTIQANQSYRISVYAKAGTASVFTIFVSVNSVTLVNNVQYNLSTGVVTGSGTMQSVGDGWYLCSATFTVGSSTSLPDIRFYNHAQGVTGGWSGTNFIYGWGAQLVEGTEAKPYLMTTNRQDVPRLDYRNADGTVSTCPRLLLEPQRTNSIRNSTMVGAVVASNTLPTNWDNILGGLTRTVVSVGTESGMQYIDVRLNGTATAINCDIRPESFNIISAATGQSWSQSAYIKTIAAPSPPNAYQFLMVERASGGSSITTGFQNYTPTTSLSRYTFTRTLSGGATVAFVQPILNFTLTNGATYDFTIRIAAPQMELGAYATTFIPTTTAAVTRTIDAASRTAASALIGQTEGTLYIEFNVPFNNRDIDLINVDAGSSANGFYVAARNSSVVQLIVRQNSTNALIFQRTGSYSVGLNKLAVAYKNGDFAISLNGTAAQINTSTITMPTGPISRIRIGEGTYVFDQPLQVGGAALFPTRLSNEDLAFITTL